MPASFRDDIPFNRSWRYSFPTERGEEVVTLSEEAILRKYFESYSENMRRVGKADEISEVGCINDWVTIHWAELVPR